METLGPYALLGELGRGGMGAVYRAHDPAHGAIAVKVIGGAELRSLEQTEALRHRFEREARLTAQLDHPGIVRVYGVGRDEDRLWIAMELLPGGSLADAIAAREFSWQEAVRLVRDVAGAMGEAHAKQVLHRDLKPTNILLDDEGAPRVVDLGLAKEIRTGSKYTRTGETLGTPAYMSPEQARGELTALTPASDVWSLGCVLYELLAGRPAFAGDTPAAVIGAVMIGNREPLHGVPAPVRELVDACLQPSPARRPPDGSALAAECDRVLAGGRSRYRPRRLRAPILGALLLAGAAGLAVALARPAAVPATAPTEPSSADVLDLERDALVERAWALRNTDPAAARSRLEHVLAETPAHPMAQLRLGLLHWSGQRGEAAVTAWEAVPDGSPEAEWARLYIGLERFFDAKGGDFDAARSSELLRVAHDRALDPDVQAIAQAAIWLQQQQYDEAIAALEPIERWEARLVLGALLYMSRRQLPRALDMLDEAALQGTDLEWMASMRAEVLMELGRGEEAIASVIASRARYPGNHELPGIHAVLLDRLGRREEALGVLRAARAEFPESRRLRRTLLDALVRAGLAEEAMEVATWFAKRNDTSHAEMLSLARALILSRRTEPARRVLRMLDEESRDPNLLAEVAWQFLEMDDAAGAERAGGRSLEHAPTHHDGRLARIEALRRLKRNAEALQEITEHCKHHAPPPAMLASKAEALARLGRWPESKAAFAEARAANPGNPKLLEAWAFLLRDGGHRAEAFAALDELVATFPSWPHSWCLRAEFRGEALRFDEALQDSDQALLLAPALPRAWAARIRCLWNLGRRAEAVRDFQAARKTVKFDQESIDAFSSMARQLARGGR